MHRESDWTPVAAKTIAAGFHDVDRRHGELFRRLQQRRR